MNRVISFSSGKGGVGKSTLVCNLGLWLAAQGKKVLLIDGDWALGKLSIMLGVRPEWTIEQVLRGEIPLHKAIDSVRENLDLLASPSGLIGFEELNEATRNQLYFELEQLESRYDYILLDHGSGVHWNVIQFAAASHQHVIVTTPEPTSFTDAYAIMKILSRRFDVRDFSLVVTMSQNELQTSKTIERYTEVVERHLNVRLRMLETFSWESVVGDSIRRRQPLMESFPSSSFAKRIPDLANQLEAQELRPHGGLNFFQTVRANR